jgi:hypothetical protein
MWQAFGEKLEEKLNELHGKGHRGTYRSADGSKR